VKRLVLTITVTAALLSAAPAAADWSVPVGSNVVADQVIPGGGYPVPAGATRPDAGTCRAGLYNSNRSESWIAVRPGTESLVGTSKLFFENFSTFYDFHLGAYAITNGTVTGASQVQGYDCVSTGTQAMPPSWTKGNRGRDLEPNNNQTSLSFGHVEDKQWVAVNHFPGTAYQDHVYAMWTTFNGAAGNGKIRLAVSRDRGQTFSKAITLTPPGTTTPATTYVYPSVGSDGSLYVAFVGGFDTTNKNRTGHVYVTKSVDDGVTFGPFVEAATPSENPFGFLPNTNFRDGIIENFVRQSDVPRACT